MRDVERLRDKIEFSLEERQVWALALSALLLLAGVFTIGLLAGRKTAALPAPAAGDLAALDAAAAAPQQQEPPARPPPAAPSATRSEPAATEALSSVGPPQPAAPEKHEPARTVQQRPATVVPAPVKPVQVASATPVALTPPPRDLGDFTVQIGSSQERTEALRLENRARAAGLRPYVVAADLGAKGTWYRVRVGAFRDRDAATRYRKDVERELRANAVVMPSH